MTRLIAPVPCPMPGPPLGGSRFVAFRPDGMAEAEIARLRAARPDLLGLSLDRPRIMGIVNVTPDSFSDGGDRFQAQDAISGAQRMAEEGADILDIGGESTRPGAEPVPIDQEIARIAPVISGLRAAGVSTPISVDTRKAAVAEAALDLGADMVNDVSAMTYDPGMAAFVARRGVPICLMHSQGDPRVMQAAPRYDDVVADIFAALDARITAALEAGIPRAHLVADPGIGFGKTLPHNLEILRNLAAFHGLGVPLLLGASRKRFIGTLSEVPQAKDRMPGSVAVALHGAGQGAHILRVHDVTETRQALALWQAIQDADGPTEA